MTADLLMRAAEKVRSVVDDASAGPWWVNDLGALVGPANTVIDEDNSADGDRAYMAVWQPEAASVVAEWLEATAGAHDHANDGSLIDIWTLPGADQHPAIRLARLILGEDA